MTLVALSTFWEDVLANLAAGVILAILVGVAVDIYLFNQRRRKAARALVKGVLEQVKVELNYNLSQTRQILTLQSSKAPPRILYVQNGWDLIRQDRVLATLQPETLQALAVLYGEFLLINADHAAVADRFHGSVTTIEFLLGIQHLIANMDPTSEDLHKARKEFVEKEKKRYIDERYKELQALQSNIKRHEIAESIVEAIARIDEEIAQVDLSRWVRATAVTETRSADRDLD